MIIEFLINWLLSIISWVIGGLSPAPSTFGSTFETSWGTIANSFGMILFMLPTEVSLNINAIIGFIVAFEFGYFLFWISDKIYKWIRG